MTIRDSYPLPVIVHLLNNLHGCKYSSKVNLKAAFNLLQMAPGDEWKTVFQTPWGLFEYQVMPFGLANAPATFQRFIQHVLREYLDVCCFVYIDDILILSRTREQHLLDLTNILQKLRKNSLKASLNKCEFFCSKVTFLGFDITDTGLKMNLSKLTTIADWPFPTNLKELQRFLGFTNFYRRLIPNFSQVAGSLTSITKGNVVDLLSFNSPDVKKAFADLKSLFVNEPMLLHFTFDQDRTVYVDSLGYAIAAVLSQPDSDGKLRPVCYFSRKLSDCERSWPIFDLELLAIVAAFEEWCAWLMGTINPVSVYSDHSNLLYFKTAKHLSPKQAQWANYLDNFNMLIYHIAGQNNPADAPSRREDFVDEKHVRNG
jgi:hypothetical protein